jgi:hypothetical protein
MPIGANPKKAKQHSGRFSLEERPVYSHQIFGVIYGKKYKLWHSLMIRAQGIP